MMRPSLALLLGAVFGTGVLVGRTEPATPAPAATTPASTPAAGVGAAPAREDRVFELRTYTSPPGQLPTLHRRFREHTLALFARHGMTNVGYWTPQDSARAGNTIVYLLAHPSREAARESWAAFGRDTVWQRVRAESEANGRIIERIESVFLDPTDYSPLR